MRNAYVEAAMDIATAVAALRLKGARTVAARDGVEIHQRGKPTLFLSYEAAREFAGQMREAEAND